MKHRLTRNLALKLLSLVVAFLIWLLVVNIDDPVKPKLFRDVRIQIINEDSVTEIDKTFDIISDEYVTIRVTERESILNRLGNDNFTVIADMENINEMDSVPLTVTCSNPAVTLDEMTIVPSSMKVSLEQKTQSDFVINVSTEGRCANGYVVGKTEVVQGKMVQIAGPESVLKRIGQVVAKVPVNGFKTDQRCEAELSVIDKNGDAFTGAQMQRIQIKDANGVLLTNNTVMVDVTMWEVMNDIPVEIQVEGEPAEGYHQTGLTTVPVTVNLVGTREALAKLDGKIILKDSISIEGATESVTTVFDITETLAEIEDLELVDGAEPTVSVTVQIEKSGDQTLRIPLSSLEILNRPEDRILTFSPADEIAVSIHTEDPNRIIARSDILASIDLSVCAEEGDHEIPVKIELPKGCELVSDVSLIVNSAIQQEQAEEAEG